MPTRAKAKPTATAAMTAPGDPAFVRDQFFLADPGGPRHRQCFDSGWKFLRDDAPGAERPGFDDGAWRTLDLPHDWSIEDLPELPPAKAPAALSVTRGRWRFMKGDDPSWKEVNLDDTAWEKVELPAFWEQHSNYTQDYVYGWFRRAVEIPPDCRDRDFTLLLGFVDDVDETYFNGVRIGGMGSFPPDYETAWNLPRRYRVNRELVRKNGPNVVAVRVFDAQGGGGIYAEISPPRRVGPFDTLLSAGQRDTGFTVAGIGWYRKRFQVDAAGGERRVTLVCDGVYMNAEVWLNGRHLGHHPYGYTAFELDLTRHLREPGKDNVLAVRVDSSGRNTRWYAGSGIYRHTWLTVTEPVHVPLWGVAVTTPKVTPAAATVRIATTLENAGALPREVTLTTRLTDDRGRAAGAATSRIALAAGQRREVVQTVTVKHPRSWSLDEPRLYQARTEVLVDGKPSDRVTSPFGIRTLRFDARKGFLLNGVPTKLKGGCMHHDNGPLGSAALDRAETRRVALMKANGYNAIRTSHNPPSQVFLDACDRLGMLVMDEAFDMWRVEKNAQDYHRFFDLWWRRDLESMVRRDRNHPSVIIWSIGNELPERAEPEGFRTAWMLADAIRALDPTRPVTSAVCPMNPWEATDGSFAALDVHGYNYEVGHYLSDHQRHPERIIAATESFPLQAFDYWMAVVDHPFVIGDFVWTGFDYLGESGIGQAGLEGEPDDFSFPWHIAYCGDIDLCGRKRQQSYYRDVLWGCGDKLHLVVQRPLPEGRKARVSLWGWPDVHASWNWPGHEGQTLEVTVYSACDQVTLSLDGRTLATKATSRETKFMATFAVPYAPGELRAVGRVKGKIVAECALHTTGTPHRLQLTSDRDAITADRNDLAYVTCEVLDRQGQVVPDAANLLRFQVTGAGELAAQANGNPRDAVSYRAPRRHAHEGRCLLVIRPTGAPGRVEVVAESDGLVAATARITVKKQ
jgi:beta-galactosidase